MIVVGPAEKATQNRDGESVEFGFHPTQVIEFIQLRNPFTRERPATGIQHRTIQTKGFSICRAIAW
jgi:hypothetical protein